VSEQSFPLSPSERREPYTGSFPYFRIYQEYKHLMGVTYAHVLEKVEWFESNMDALAYWHAHGGDANLSHIIACAVFRERMRRTRVINEAKFPELKAEWDRYG